MPSPFRDSVSELGFLRLKSKFIKFYPYFQWKIWGRSWPGAISSNQFKKNLINCVLMMQENGVILIQILVHNALIQKKYDTGHAGELVSSNRYFQKIAAITAPISGATINSQSCDSAIPPATTAGPRLRAGFTEVPVMGIVTI